MDFLEPLAAKFNVASNYAAFNIVWASRWPECIRTGVAGIIGERRVKLFLESKSRISKRGELEKRILKSGVKFDVTTRAPELFFAHIHVS